MSQDFAIRAEGLGKRYQLGVARQHNSVRDLLVDKLGSLFRPSGSQQATKTFWALKEASFDIRHGENVGIIGLNGAGKSTLLKILSRIVEPTEGRARIDGRVGALLEVGTGFHGELTGRENVFLYGSILGMSKDEVRRKFDAIVEFSGVRDFIDTPVKRFSSGMYVRLAFAVAAHLEPEILLLDEVLAVGDLTFQRKCIEFAKELQRKDATILFVSHNMFSIKTMCERVIYLKQGRVIYDGPTEGGIALYEQDSPLSTVPWVRDDPSQWPIRLTEVALLDSGGQRRTVFDFGEPMTVRLAYQTRGAVSEPNFIVAFIRSDGVACCNFSNETDDVQFSELEGQGVVELKIPPLKLISETYTVSVFVREKGFQKLLCAQVGGTFHVRHHLYDLHFGVFHESAQWRLEASRTPAAAQLEPESQS
jgi:lipopolysaccharide transport system ATP-binding protein